MKLAYTILTFMLLVSCGIQGQSISVERAVIGSAGGHHLGSFDVSYSIGEAVVATGVAEATAATQGFEQPSRIDLLVVEVQTTPESCRGASDGTATISVSGCTGPYEITWSNGQAGLSATGLPFGAYHAVVAAENCSQQIVAYVDLTEDINCRLVFYSGITPNEDGDNDYWHIDNIDLPQFSDNVVQVFNRWGDEVWAARGYNNAEVRWEGQGKQSGNLPDGTYFYVVEVNNTTHKGYVELTR